MVGLFDEQPKLTFSRRLKTYDREAIMYGTPEEKYEFVEEVPIHVESFTLARSFIDALFERGKRSKYPGGIWLLGHGGVGKSFILADLFKRYPQIDTNIARITPVLALSFEARPSVSSILIELLIQLGQDPQLIHFKNNSELQDMLIQALPSCGTAAICFDEAQHLWLTSRPRKNPDRKGGPLGDFIKKLYDKANVAFIFSGTPGLEEIYREDFQANTRWSGTMHIKALSYKQFVGVLNAIDEAIPLKEKFGLGCSKIARKLYIATSGNFRLLKKLLAEAVYLAAKKNANKLSLENLSEAFFMLFCDRKNPFV